MAIVTFYLGAAFYAIFNVIKPKKIAILMGLYIIPAFVSGFSIWLGKNKLGVHIPNWIFAF